MIIIILRTTTLLFGGLTVCIVAISAIRTLVLTRGARDVIAAAHFRLWRLVFDWRANRTITYEDRDRIMALYAPLSLITLPLLWLSLVAGGYTLIFLALGVSSLYDAFVHSGSALTTLGFSKIEGTAIMIVTFSESAIGLILVALLISYLPTMYSAFSARETAVTLLEVRAGMPPSAITIIIRSHRIRGLDNLSELWEQWELWFAEIQESHTSLAALVFFRSTKPGQSWLTAAGTVLDCASLYASTLNVPRNPQAEICIRSGYLALRALADLFMMDHDPDPAPTDPISVSRVEFDTVYDEMLAAGVPLKPDRDQCWRAFAGWRVNYDAVLLQLAALTMAPYAPWISDRSLPGMGQ
jgi:hypothetical protein